jgi:ACS family tartrate transporter-like MFS transporter
MLGAPLATGIMELHGIAGFQGWQWLFILEGAVTVAVGLFTLGFLPTAPREATWLTAVERKWLTDTLAHELAAKERAGMTRLMAGFLNKRVLLALLIGFFLLFTNFGTIMWLPQMIKAFGGLTNMEVGLLSVLPFACGAVGMIFCGRSSDRTGERRWYVVGAAALASTGLDPPVGVRRAVRRHDGDSQHLRGVLGLRRGSSGRRGRRRRARLHQHFEPARCLPRADLRRLPQAGLADL